MSDSYKITDQQGTYFLTFQIVEWADIFSRKIYRDIIVDALNYCIDHKSLKVYAWVVMTNHVHAIMQTEDKDLSDVVRDFKAHTAREILKAIDNNTESRRTWMKNIFTFNAMQQNRNEKLQIWSHENHAVYLDPITPQLFESKLHYIHQNPVRAGWVEEPEQYIYSSARDYTGKSGLVKVVLA
jgi:putative transposase